MQNNISLKIHDMDLLEQSNKTIVREYVADIRNLRKLTKEKINTVALMKKEEIMVILNAYNDMIGQFSEYIDQLS